MIDNQLTTTNGNGKLLAIHDPAMLQEMAKKFVPILRELVVNGRRLTEEQIAGRAMFAAVEGLDPITEVQTLTDRDGKTMAHQMGMNGYRRKCLEQLRPGDEVNLEFVELHGESLPKGVAYGYECRLRDGTSYTQWQKRLIEVGKAVREAMGGEITFDQLLQLVGPPPISTGVGFFWLDEFNPYKDKNFPPQERAKKRAERNARSKRFPTTAPVYDAMDGVAIYSEDVIEGKVMDQPQAAQVKSSKTVAQLNAELGFSEPMKQIDPQKEISEHDIKVAEAEYSESQHCLYGQIPSEKLDMMRMGMANAKNQTDDHRRKVAAITVILDARGKGREVQPIEAESEPAADDPSAGWLSADQMPA